MSTHRFDSLQGLRGVAALAVAVSHFFALFYLTGYDDGTTLEKIRPISHLFGILAHKAVWIFFVLSGFVLMHQLSSRTYTYRQYLLARLIRLYLPVWSAIILNLLVIYFLVSQGEVIEFWIGTDPDSLSIRAIILELLLLPKDYFLGPLWSLRWEVAFSLVAFIVWKSKLFLRVPKFVGFVSIALAAVGEAINSGLLKFIPMFIVGAIIYNSLIRSGIRSPISNRFEFLSVLLAVSLPVTSFIVFSEKFGLAEYAYTADVSSSLISIWLIFIALLRGSWLRRLFEISVLQALGNISFSLYLFHAPVMLLAFYLSNFNVYWTLFAFFMCFPISYAGFVLVESPAQKMSRKVRARSRF